MEAFISRPRTAEEIVRQLAGSAPGPVLHTADTDRAFREALVRRYSAESDDPFVALELIRTSGGLERTAGLALEHAQHAIDAATKLAAAGPLRSGMINLVDHVLKSGS